MINDDSFKDLISNKIDNAKNANSENFAYAVGDYLRLPKLYGAEGFDTEKLTNETMRNWSGYLYPESIVHLYYKSASREHGSVEARIIPEILRSTVYQYTENLKDKSKLKQVLLDEDAILVHLRIGDIGDISQGVLSKLEALKSLHPRFIVVAGIHSAWMHSSVAWGMDEAYAKNRTYENARTSFAKLYEAIGSFDWLVCEPDIAMCAALLTNKLFIHRGGFSAALGLLTSGMIYATNEFQHFQNWETKEWPTWEKSLHSSSSLTIL